jgi:hypothetical protein
MYICDVAHIGWKFMERLSGQGLASGV